MVTLRGINLIRRGSCILTAVTPAFPAPQDLFVASPVVTTSMSTAIHGSGDQLLCTLPPADSWLNLSLSESSNVTTAMSAMRVGEGGMEVVVSLALYEQQRSSVVRFPFCVCVYNSV